MKFITCDRCGNPSEPFNDPDYETNGTTWMPTECYVKMYGHPDAAVTDLCGRCTYEVNMFLEPIDPVTRVKQANLPQAGAR